MYKKIILTCDPCRPMTANQRKGNLIFVQRLLNILEQCPDIPQNNSNYELWAKNYELWVDSSFGLEKIDTEDLIIIGYEMSPGFVQYCKSHNIAYISISISPIRFLEDLLICYSTNIAKIPLNSAQICEPEIESAAIKLIAKNRSGAPIEKMAGNIIIEQLPLDSSTISKGGFLGLQDVIEHYQLKKFRILKHPFSRVTSIYNVNINPYRLMSLNSDVTLFGISSSLLTESKYFNVTSHRMITNRGLDASNESSGGTIGFPGILQLREYLNDFTMEKSNDIKSVRVALGYDWSRK